MDLTRRFDHALALALHLHRAQRLKGTPVPYVAHLLTVAGLVMRFGGSEDQVIAALLHDAAEDAGGEPTLDFIRAHFGEVVAAIVGDCTDTMENPKPDWKVRKTKYIKSIAAKPGISLLVSACDKLDNARAIVADLRRDGPETLRRFRGGAASVCYYEAISKAFLDAAARGTPAADVAQELELAVREMRRLAGPGVDCLRALEAPTEARVRARPRRRRAEVPRRGRP